MSSRLRAGVAVLVALVLVVASCTGSSSEPGTPTSPDAPPATNSVPPSDGLLRNQVGYVLPAAPDVTVTGELEPQTRMALDDLWESLTESIDVRAILALGDSGDVRLAWLLADLLRFVRSASTRQVIVTAWSTLTDVDLTRDPIVERSEWQSMTDHLIAWDLPAHPGYRGYKSRLFTIIEPAWQPFFDDSDANIDWRLMTWGGVLIDDRHLGDLQPCTRGCIPALDDPEVTSADEGSWYPDDRIVFGIVINGEARAYPKHQMEVHEIVNDTIGGRRLGIPYCTLCGSAQAYFTDSVPSDIATPVLRTSGLLNRSNKVMFDLNTFSVFNTFTGAAISGPLRERGVVLEQTTVVTSTWGEWKAAHPDTTIVAQDAGLGRTYSLDPLRGRDDDGAIFPIGDVDPRLPHQSQVLGVIAPNGVPIAFPVDRLRVALEENGFVVLEGVTISTHAGGFVASLADGTLVAAHQSFWFAWAQFHPETLVWSAPQTGG
ncbi:MAG: DUF3179 domain-containing (seleno)protein [Actinomycetota bacterium]|nr:DUF3179 domain-containing (seleno)protein [Actinomycetota bacterium]